MERLRPVGLAGVRRRRVVGLPEMLHQVSYDTRRAQPRPALGTGRDGG